MRWRHRACDVPRRDADRAGKNFLRVLNDEHLKRNPDDAELTGRIAAYELAARMQLSAPEVSDLSRESAPTRALYGLRIRQPIGGDFGVSGDLVRHYLAQDDWTPDISRFGIDIWMTTTAAAPSSSSCWSRC